MLLDTVLALWFMLFRFGTKKLRSFSLKQPRYNKPRMELLPDVMYVSAGYMALGPRIASSTLQEEKSCGSPGMTFGMFFLGSKLCFYKVQQTDQKSTPKEQETSFRQKHLQTSETMKRSSRFSSSGYQESALYGSFLRTILAPLPLLTAG